MPSARARITGPDTDEARLVAALRDGDEEAFMDLVERYMPVMLRVARMYVPPAVAGDVVQETWIGVLRGIDRFEERSSLRTWLLGITANQARRWAARVRRDLPASALGAGDDEAGATPVVPPDRFLDGRWTTLPARWSTLPEDRLLSAELRGVIDDAVAGLGERQREVITLRDLEGRDADEVVDLLGITPNHQRVLLHRARAAVRSAVDDYLGQAA